MESKKATSRNEDETQESIELPDATDLFGIDEQPVKEDLETVVERLRTGHSSVLVVVHDERTEHIGLWAKSTRSVSPLTFDYAQTQGFAIVEAGIRHCNETGDDRGWAEFRRKKPSEVYGGEDE